MNEIVDRVVQAIESAGMIQVEVSGKHVHLSQVDLEKLFGPGTVLTPKRQLSQPGQFLSEQRVTIQGPKGKKDRVAVLGPVRENTQVELSKTDCAELGIKAVVRESGNIEGSSPATLIGEKGSVDIIQGCIVAKSHIHMTPATAARLGLVDKQQVRVALMSKRPLTFHNVILRVSGSFRDRMHIDFDEANAGDVEGVTLGRIILEK